MIEPVRSIGHLKTDIVYRFYILIIFKKWEIVKKQHIICYVCNTDANSCQTWRCCIARCRSRKDSMPNWKDYAVTSFKSPLVFDLRSYSAWGGPNQWCSKVVEQKTGHFHSTKDSSNGESLILSSPLANLLANLFCELMAPLPSPVSSPILSEMLQLNKPFASLISVSASQQTQLIYLYMNIVLRDINRYF